MNALKLVEIAYIPVIAELGRVLLSPRVFVRLWAMARYWGESRSRN